MSDMRREIAETIFQYNQRRGSGGSAGKRETSLEGYELRFASIILPAIPALLIRTLSRSQS